MKLPASCKTGLVIWAREISKSGHDVMIHEDAGGCYHITTHYDTPPFKSWVHHQTWLEGRLKWRSKDSDLDLCVCGDPDCCRASGCADLST